MLYKTLLSILVFCISIHDVQPTRTTLKKDTSWDVLIFTQEWPTTVCDEWKEKNSTHTCKLPKQPNSWSIHGVWPTKYNSMGPFNCNSSARFDPKAILPIEDELLDHWTNIYADTSSYSLWAHEWTKHGTCAAQLKEFDTELKYFSKGLEFYNNYNLTSILSEADIVPSVDRAYDVVDIVNAIRVHLGVNPVVECRKEKGKSKLIEIRLCFSKSLALIDCDGVVHSVRGDSVLSNCDRTQGVLYLPFNTIPDFTIVELYKLVTWLQWFTL